MRNAMMGPNRAVVIALSILGGILMAPSAEAADPAPAKLRSVTIDEVLKPQTPTMIENVSWLDPSTLIASRREAGAKGNSIVKFQLDTGRRDRIGAGTYPSVSPDGKWLVYLDGLRWKLKPLSGGKAVKISATQRPSTELMQRPQWSRDSRYIAIHELFSVRVAAMQTTSPPAAAQPAGKVASGAVNVVDVGRSADLRTSNSFVYTARIIVVDVQNPKQVRTLDVGDPAYYSGWGAGDELYFVTVHYGFPRYTALEQLDLRTMKRRERWRLDGGVMQAAAPVVSPDGNRVALLIDVDTKKWDDFNSIVVLDLRSGQLQRLTTSVYVSETLWSRDGQSLFFVGRQGGLDQIFKANLHGAIALVSSGERRHFELELSSDGGSLCYQTEDGYGRRDIRVRSVENGTDEKIVETINDHATTLRLGRFEQVRYPTSDGLQIYGYLIYPPDFDPSRKYPLYIDVHGGGPGSYLYLIGPLTAVPGLIGPLEWHAWAALGYVVFVPDYRSSGEYGPQIGMARYRDNDYGGVERDARDIEEATRWAVEKDFIDPKRVAIHGQSAGGARINYLLTRSRLYGAAIINDPIGSGPIADVLGLTSGENAGARFEEFYWSMMKSTDGVRFADNPSAYLSGFLFDGYRNKTPTLILVGNPAKGAMGPISTEVLFSMLRQYDVPARMLRYMDDGHGPESVASSRHRFEEVRAWLEKYIPPTN